MAQRNGAPAKEPRAPATPKKAPAQKATKPLTAWQMWSRQPGAIAELCEFISSNGTKGHIAAFCQARGFLYTTVRAWIEADAARVAMYARAREDRADTLADEIVAISDEIEVENVTTPDGESTLRLDSTAVARNRLRVDARKWAAAKLKPRTYGEKVQHGGDPDGVPIEHNMTVRFVESHQQ